MLVLLFAGQMYQSGLCAKHRAEETLKQAQRKFDWYHNALNQTWSRAEVAEEEVRRGSRFPNHDEQIAALARLGIKFKSQSLCEFWEEQQKINPSIDFIDFEKLANDSQGN
jgi:hypothetical protein